MGRKKFGWKDALSLTAQAASVASNFTNPTQGVDKSFKDGNATNLKGSEGGASPLKANTSKNIDRSPLAKEYNRKNFMN